MLIRGTVIHGNHQGRTIGFPTANVHFTQAITDLKPGVYAAWLTTESNSKNASKTYAGMGYFGPNYVARQLDNQFDIYLFDFNGNLYGQTVQLELVAHVREPIPFTSLEKLKKQLFQDAIQVKQLLGYTNGHESH